MLSQLWRAGKERRDNWDTEANYPSALEGGGKSQNGMNKARNFRRDPGRKVAAVPTEPKKGSTGGLRQWFFPDWPRKEGKKAAAARPLLLRKSGKERPRASTTYRATKGETTEGSQWAAEDAPGLTLEHPA